MQNYRIIVRHIQVLCFIVLIFVAFVPAVHKFLDLIRIKYFPLNLFILTALLTLTDARVRSMFIDVDYSRVPYALVGVYIKSSIF